MPCLNKSANIIDVCAACTRIRRCRHNISRAFGSICNRKSSNHKLPRELTIRGLLHDDTGFRNPTAQQHMHSVAAD